MMQAYTDAAAAGQALIAAQFATASTSSPTPKASAPRQAPKPTPRTRIGVANMPVLRQMSQLLEIIRQQTDRPLTSWADLLTQPGGGTVVELCLEAGELAESSVGRAPSRSPPWLVVVLPGPVYSSTWTINITRWP
jgi:hypothetical protein